jgi:putative addiction module component (TIGR02574 family)
MSTVDDIRNQALELSPEDRARLARDLLLSLEPETRQEESESAWAGEIEARSAAVARGEFTASDWRESLERIRETLSKRRRS